MARWLRGCPQNPPQWEVSPQTLILGPLGRPSSTQLMAHSPESPPDTTLGTLPSTATSLPMQTPPPPLFRPTRTSPEDPAPRAQAPTCCMSLTDSTCPRGKPPCPALAPPHSARAPPHPPHSPQHAAATQARSHPLPSSRSPRHQACSHTSPRPVGDTHTCQSAIPNARARSLLSLLGTLQPAHRPLRKAQNLPCSL